MSLAPRPSSRLETLNACLVGNEGLRVLHLYKHMFVGFVQVVCGTGVFGLFLMCVDL